MVENDERIHAALDAALRRHHERRAATPALPPASGQPATDHPSHTRFVLRREPADADTALPCLIEPTVECSHCGYCLSYGH